MNVCVSYVYWMLLFTTVASSALLFIIVASENTQNSKFIGPDKNHPESYTEKENVNFSEHSQDHLESDSDTESEVKVASPLNSNIRTENSQDVQDPISTDYNINYSSEESKVDEGIEIIKDSLAQKPNISYGISDGVQPVVVTLVDGTASLQDLTSGHRQPGGYRPRRHRRANKANDSGLAHGNDEHDDDAGNDDHVDDEDADEEDEYRALHNLSDSGGGGYAAARRLARQQTLEAAVNATGGGGGGDSDVVVVVRAERKSVEDEQQQQQQALEDAAGRSIRDAVESVMESLPKTSSEEQHQREAEDELKNQQQQQQQTPKSSPPASSSSAVPELNDSAARARLAGSGDDSAAAMLDSLVTAGPSDPHEEIPSFNEWAQKRLEEAEKKKAHPNVSVQTATGSPGRSVNNMRMRSKNYASPDCGAKIVAANPEARSARNVLVSTRDEYMLNTCTTRVWFVVELCEAIQAKKIELANFELFSSVPKDISIHVSDRFPTRDWSNVGHFTARDERDVQSFSLQPQLFGKFVKVELLSHYGSEHFCPISLFRAYGASELEVLETETETDATADGHQKHEARTEGSTALGGDPDNDDEDDEDSLFDDDDESSSDRSGNLFGSARDAVLSLVRKAAEVLAKSGDLRPTNNITKIQESIRGDVLEDATLDDCSTPVRNVTCRNCSDDRFARVFQLISCKESFLDSLLEAEFVRETLIRGHLCSANFGFDTLDYRMFYKDGGNVLDNADSDLAKYYIQAKFLTSLFSFDYIIALCNVLVSRGPEANTSHREQQIVGETANDTANDEDEEMPREGDEGEGVVPIGASEIKPTKTTVPNDELKLQPITVKLEPNVGFESENGEQEVNTGTTQDLPGSDTAKQNSAASSKISTEQELDTTVDPAKFQQPNIQSDPSTISTKSPQNSDNSQLSNEKSNESVDMETENEEVVEGKVKVEIAEQEVKQTSQDQLNFDGFDFKDFEMDNVQNGQLNGGAKTDFSATQQTASLPQKESVFLRLSNRIKVLERNMSLSSQYLEELSRRYKKQVEEMQRSLERAVTTMNEESRKGEERENKRLEEINTLRNQIDVLTKILNELVYEQNSWSISFSSLTKHVLFVLVDVFLVILILLYCKRTDDDMDYFDMEGEVDERSIAAKTTKRKNYEIVKQKCTQLMKKPKKRRPSEIASQVSGTYDQLMIENPMNLNYMSKKDKRKKRKKDIAVLRSSSIKETSGSNKTYPNSYNNIIKEMVPSRSVSANDALNNGNDGISIMDTRRQNRPESAPDNSISYFGDHQLLEQPQYDKKIQILSVDSYQNESSNNYVEQNNISGDTSCSFEDDKLEQEKSNGNGSRMSFKKVPSPSFMKTALISRSKRLYLSGKSSKKRSESVDESMVTSLERRYDEKLDLQHDSSNSIGDEMNIRQSKNDRIEESDESRSSSATPTSWKKKEKKNNGLRKMVRKFF